ncbi:MAG TPA: TadE family protein [Blastocatellia bacterium]|nr:TadE family protein [Blastocatellia bacterium]
MERARVRTSRRQRGQSLVEAAFVIPLLLFLILAIVDLGRLAFAWVTVQYAAGAGARFAVTGVGEQNGTRLGLIKQAAKRWSDLLPGQNAHINVRSWRGRRASGAARENNAGGPCDLVEVEVLYTYRTITPIVGRLIPPIQFRGRERMVNERWGTCD